MSDNTHTLANSIWPNGIKVDSDGYAVYYPLGTNKVDIPTTEDAWPVGDKLISPFVYKNNKLIGFCDTKAMTVSGSGSTTMPYTHIEADFASIEEGKLVINAPNATTKKFTWAVVPTSDGSFDYVIVDYITAESKALWAVRDAYRVVDKKMFDVDGNVIGTWDTSKLEVAGYYDSSGEWGMIYSVFCNINSVTYENLGLTLTEFDSDLSSLRNGFYMFWGCDMLTSFTGDLSSLTDCEGMFSGCSNLTTFTSDLSSLTNGQNMFDCCRNLTTFTSDLSSLTNGYGMFLGCSKLTTFTSDLSSLTHADGMFRACKLNASSVKNIINTINTVSSGSRQLMLGMGCNDTTSDKDLFAQEVGYADMNALLAAINAKGWTVLKAQYNGRPATTYTLRRPTEDTLPIYAKLEEVILPTEEEIALAKENDERIMTPHYEYTSEDGSKFFNINWFHETTGSTEGYTQFNSLEEAVEYFNIKPIERN